MTGNSTQQMVFSYICVMDNPFDIAINESLATLRSGGIILYPTDTIWGIGADASNEKAMEKVLAVKGRPAEKSMILLLDDSAKLNRYIRQVPDIAWDIVDNATEPITIIYPGAYNLPKNCIAADGTVAIRITDDPFCKLLVKKLNKPLISTSANISGKPSPSCFREISETIISSVDYVVNLRRNENGCNKPSSIIQLGINGEIRIIRK